MAKLLKNIEFLEQMILGGATAEATKMLKKHKFSSQNRKHLESMLSKRIARDAKTSKRRGKYVAGLRVRRAVIRETNGICEQCREVRVNYSDRHLSFGEGFDHTFPISKAYLVTGKYWDKLCSLLPELRDFSDFQEFMKSRLGNHLLCLRCHAAKTVLESRIDWQKPAESAAFLRFIWQQYRQSERKWRGDSQAAKIRQHFVRLITRAQMRRNQSSRQNRPIAGRWESQWDSEILRLQERMDESLRKGRVV